MLLLPLTRTAVNCLLHTSLSHTPAALIFSSLLPVFISSHIPLRLVFFLYLPHALISSRHDPNVVFFSFFPLVLSFSLTCPIFDLLPSLLPPPPFLLFPSLLPSSLTSSLPSPFLPPLPPLSPFLPDCNPFTLLWPLYFISFSAICYTMLFSLVMI